MSYYTMKDDEGKEYKMGFNLNQVGPGDVIKVASGRLEKIVSIAKKEGSKWDKDIKTEVGVRGMMDVLSYGKSL